MPPIAHPGRLLKRELVACGLSADRLARFLFDEPDREHFVRAIDAAAVRLGHVWHAKVGFVLLRLKRQHSGLRSLRRM